MDWFTLVRSRAACRRSWAKSHTTSCGRSSAFLVKLLNGGVLFCRLRLNVWVHWNSHKSAHNALDLFYGLVLLWTQPELLWQSCVSKTNKQANKQTKSRLLSLLSQLDRTEVIKSNLHPVFAKVFSLDYYFEEVQKLRFEVYDIHGTHSIGTRDDDFLGGVECTLGQVGRRLRPSLKTQLCNGPEACGGRPLSAPLTSSVGSAAD